MYSKYNTIRVDFIYSKNYSNYHVILIQHIMFEKFKIGNFIFGYKIPAGKFPMLLVVIICLYQHLLCQPLSMVSC